jgi:hypothetical protein
MLVLCERRCYRGLILVASRAYLPTDSGNAGARFPTTHWSEVARAGVVDPQIKRQALGRLLGTYLPALRAHLLGAKRMNADGADDLLQGFICDQVVAADLMARADRQRGRFRGFVVTALDRYAARVARAENAEKRKPTLALLSLEDHEPSGALGGRAADPFDVAWARQVVQHAIDQMRIQCSSGRAEQVWLVFKSCALEPLLNGTEPPAHHQTMKLLGLGSVQEVSNTLVTAKRTFARVLRAIVGEYFHDKNEIEAELRDLFAILSRSRQGIAARLR